MLYEVMKHIRNFFPVERGWHEGVFTISQGTLNLPFLQDGQYFLIEDSVFNDGVYQYPAYGLTDEVFKGTVTALKIPADFLSLVADIENWDREYGNKNSPFISESLQGVYSYTKASSAMGTAGVMTWKDAYKSRLNTWRMV